MPKTKTKAVSKKTATTTNARGSIAKVSSSSLGKYLKENKLSHAAWAAVIGVTSSTVYKWISDGHMPKYMSVILAGKRAEARLKEKLKATPPLTKEVAYQAFGVETGDQPTEVQKLLTGLAALIHGSGAVAPTAVAEVAPAPPVERMTDAEIDTIPCEGGMDAILSFGKETHENGCAIVCVYATCSETSLTAFAWGTHMGSAKKAAALLRRKRYRHDERSLYYNLQNPQILS